MKIISIRELNRKMDVLADKIFDKGLKLMGVKQSNNSDTKQDEEIDTQEIKTTPTESVLYNDNFIRIILYNEKERFIVCKKYYNEHGNCYNSEVLFESGQIKDN